MGGTWYADEGPGVYGHEVRHLMGLPDRYLAFRKQPDGSWVNERNPAEMYSAQDFLNLYHSKHPNDNLSDDQNFLNHIQRAGWTKNGSENDLMGDASKPPTQSDIDNLAAQAGLIIHVKAGDVLSNKDNSEQNFVITHSDDYTLGPGEIITWNGLYAQCIDHEKGVPDSSEYFDVAPPLDKWNGIHAAEDLLKLVRYIDTTKYYCGFLDLTVVRM